MVKVTKVVKEQGSVLLKSSFLTEKGHPGLEYIQTFSVCTRNILVAFLMSSKPTYSCPSPSTEDRKTLFMADPIVSGKTHSLIYRSKHPLPKHGRIDRKLWILGKDTL
jgi:hypothetical protein